VCVDVDIDVIYRGLVYHLTKFLKNILIAFFIISYVE
jgi:hypothetical protein